MDYQRDAHKKPTGAPHVHELITEIFSDLTHGIDLTKSPTGWG
jgi:hypothetical protein